jgi:hypothetical protein
VNVPAHIPPYMGKPIIIGSSWIWFLTKVSHLVFFTAPLVWLLLFASVFRSCILLIVSAVVKWISGKLYLSLFF